MKKNFMMMLLLMGGMMFTACGGDDGPNDNNGNNNNGDDNPGTTGGQDEKEWNKDNTLQLHYITSLNDASANGNIEKVAEYVKTNDVKLGVVDNTDVLKYADQTACQNASTLLSHLSAKFCSFVMEGYHGDNIDGSTIVLSHKLNTVEGKMITADCFMQYLPTQALSMTSKSKYINIPLAVVKFSQQEQINAAEEALRTFTGNSYKAVVVGEVKSDLLNALIAKVATLPGLSFSAVMEPTNDYTLFVVTRSDWKFREMTTETVGTQTDYILAVEAL